MLSSVCWVSKVAAKSIPVKYEITEAEAAAFLAESNAYIEENAMGLQQAKGTPFAAMGQRASNSDMEEEEDEEGNDKNDEHDKHAQSDHDPVVKKYQLDEYPSESEDDADMQDHAMEKVFSHMSDLTMGDQTGADPYLRGKGEELEELEDKDDLHLLPSDFLIVAARAPEDDDIATIEYYVYEEAEDNLYVHHDIMLPSYPLCLEWMDWVSPTMPPDSEHGNLVAVGTFDPEIEIWNLDLLDPVYPELILGASSKAVKAKSSSKAKMELPKVSEERHTDAVMCLSWNKTHRGLLASGSADMTVKLWDLSRPATALRSYATLHEDKIQSLQWNPFETSMLASAGYDQRVAVFDTRSPDAALHYGLMGDAEVLKWDPFHEHCFAVSDDTGTIHYVDIRALSSTQAKSKKSSKSSKSNKSSKSEAIWTLHAHEKAASCIDFNPFIPSLMVSGSLDKRVKIWDIAAPTPTSLIEKDFGLGKLFSVNFSLDSPFLISLAGKKGELLVWNLNTWQLMKTDDNLAMNQLRELMASRLAKSQ